MKSDAPSSVGRFGILSKNPLSPLSLAAVIGILIGDHLGLPLWASFTALVGLFALAIFPRFRGSAAFLFCLTAATFAALHHCRLDIHERFPFAALLEQHGSISVIATGLVAEEPLPLDYADRFRYPLRLDQIESSDHAWRATHTIAVEQSGPPPSYGDRIEIHGNLEPIRPARNPGEFNFDYFFSRKGIVAEIYVSGSDRVVILEHRKGSAFYELALHSREWIRETITRDLSDAPDVSAVLTAMVLGDRRNTPPEIEAHFNHSGALHIFSVSGLHVGIFGTIVWIFLRILGLRRQTAVFLIVPCLFFYAYVTGLPPSALRAAIMASIFLCGFVFARQPRLLNSLAAACLIVLAYDSQQLFLPGFQLSFAVVAFIALLAGPLHLPMREWAEPDPFLPRVLVPAWRRGTARIGTSFASLLSVSTAAWIGSAPLSLWHFQLVTPIAVISNCILVPLSGIVLMIATTSLLTAGAGLTGLSILVNKVNWLAAKTLIVSTSAFASIPGGHFYIHHALTWQRDQCSVTVRVTGLGGSCQLITFTDPQAAILVDAAGRNTYFESTLPFLRGALRSRLDGAIVTHGDAQHLAGMIPLLRDYPPEVIYQSALTNRSPYYKDLIETMAARPSKAPILRTVVAGDTIHETFDPDQSLRVLYPPAGILHARDADDQCVVLQLTCHPWKVLFMSDSGFIAEKWLLENVSPDTLRSDLLIKGQHRSDYSGLPEFLNAVDPQIIVATNFEFPAEEKIPEPWLETLATRGITLLDQSRTGAVTIRITEERLSLSSHLTRENLSLKRP